MENRDAVLAFRAMKTETGGELVFPLLKRANLPPPEVTQSENSSSTAHVIQPSKAGHLFF